MPIGALAYQLGAHSDFHSVGPLANEVAFAGFNRNDLGPDLYTDVKHRAYSFLANEVERLVPLLEFGMPPELAAAALEAFVHFWHHPDDVDGVLRRLEEARLAYLEDG